MTLKELTEMDDLISRWEAFKAVMDDENITNAMDSANDGEMHRTKRAASRIIAGLPSAQQWTPCNEKLPKETGVYLVTKQSNAYPVAEAMYMADDAYWADTYAGNGYRDGYIIAWMPLPKPYEVKQ